MMDVLREDLIKARTKGIDLEDADRILREVYGSGGSGPALVPARGCGRRGLSPSGYASAVHRLLSCWEADPRAAVPDRAEIPVDQARGHMAVIAGPVVDPIDEARAYLIAAELLVAEADRISEDARGSGGDIVCAMDFDEAHDLLEGDQ